MGDLNNQLVYFTNQDNTTYENQNYYLSNNQTSTLSFLTKTVYFAYNMGTSKNILDKQLNSLAYISDNDEITYENQNYYLSNNQTSTLSFITRACLFAYNMGTSKNILETYTEIEEDEILFPLFGKKPSEIGLPYDPGLEL